MLILYIAHIKYITNNKLRKGLTYILYIIMSYFVRVRV